jgi:1-acyl-sn-glycerol-3-phosphate acyltransferase
MLMVLRMLLLSVHFVLASILGLLCSLSRPFNPDNNRIAARIYALPALRILGVRAQWDLAQLQAAHPAVIVANHISNYDLFVFGPAVPPRTATLGKTSLKWIPLFGQLYWLAGSVLIDRGNAVKAKKAMLITTDTIQNKDVSIWVFAEGTRGHGKGLAPFKKGAFQMAINAGVPIIPLCVNNYVRGMRLNRWQSCRVAMRALPPIPTAGLTLDDLPELMARCHSQMKACIDELDRQAGTTQLP